MGLAASLMAAAPADAQTRAVTTQEKEAFVRAAIPAMLEQVKQISGIDIVGLASPTIGEVIASPLFGTESMLRAAEKQAIGIQPDSMTVNVGAMSESAPAFVSNLTIRFTNYKEFSMTTTDQREVTISVPQRISTSVLGMEMGLDLSFGERKGLLPFSTFTASLDLGILGEIAGSYFPGLKSGELVAMAERSQAGTYIYDVTLGDPLKAIIGMIGNEATATALPDFRVNVDLSALPKDTVKASLQGIYSNGVLPMGDAKVILYGKEQGSLFAGQIALTSYKKGTNQKEKDELILRTREIEGNRITLGEQTYVWSEEEHGWISEELTYTDFQGNHPVDGKAIAYSIIGGILSDLQKGSTTPYAITKTAFPGGNHIENGGVVTDKISITPSMVGMQAAKFEIQFEDNDKGQGLEKTMLITINMPTKGNQVTVDFHPAKFDAPISTLYLTSNALGVITDNETIEESAAPKLTVSSTGSGLYVRNGKGNYAVVNMVGRVVATGQITSDDAYLTIPNLTNGIYMISIDKADGTGRDTVKFRR